MTPQLFEALAYLKVNRHFWSQTDVNKAMLLAKTQMAKERIERDLAQLELEADSDDEE